MLIFPTALRLRCLMGFVATLLVAGAASCGDSGPTTPSGPAPEISSVDPGEVVPGPGLQTLTVSGQGFTTGFTVFVTPPNGSRTEVSSDALQGTQNLSFQISVPFETPGEYLLTVRLVSGIESNDFRVTARAAGGTVPRIDVVTPGAVQTGPGATVVTLTGANFSTGSSVTITSPDGTTNVLPASSLLSLTSTSIQLSLVFGTAGSYSVSVANSQGQSSNTTTITAF